MSAGTSPPVAALAELYGPTAHELANTLVNIGGGLQAQCERLAADPTIEGCEQIASNLDGARRHVLRLRERLMADGRGGPHDRTP